ncbi:MAG: thiosulfate oxidation carrier protein SoxY [Granulosicoccus sp.]|nr:thiosulfate oxidation carrier protein SoxY [Granulosicoccus sp.]
MNVSRRKVLTSSVSAALASLFVAQSSRVWATPEDAKALIDTFTGGADSGSGALTLTAPEIAENGNTVPIAVMVESPMTADSYVESIMIVAEDNPRPEVATFHFTPASGIAKASTRMRLAKTQNVIAIAKMNDGSVFSDSKNVKVTIGGCGG